MPYKIREDVATADVAFEAEGATFEEMCVSAAEATTRIMVDPQTLKEKKTKSFAVKGETPEKLLFNFLNEIIYIKDAELLLFKSFIVKKQGAALKCKAKGEKLDFEKQTHGVDVKAVTYHMFEVKEEHGKWKAFVILDI
ncbi:MAG: archease [Candidatus Aenigmarchaeota archaeon]|nr:archease [Candidatus Aenigmarchaeota archaeon]